jgi:hypothetical protein
VALGSRAEIVWAVFLPVSEHVYVTARRLSLRVGANESSSTAEIEWSEHCLFHNGCLMSEFLRKL